MENEIKYQEICKILGFVPEMEYVRVNRRGNIEPTAGTRDEAVALWKAVKRAGFKPSSKFRALARKYEFET
jgi:hypothetical protein